MISLGIRELRQQDGRTALKWGPTTLILMAAERLHSKFGKGDKSFENIATLVYHSQVEILALAQTTCNSEDAEYLYYRIKGGLPLIIEEDIVLQQCTLLYQKHV